MKFKRTERDFSASEVEEVAGISQATQRDWRRRGFIGGRQPGKRAKYSLAQVCRFLVVSTLTKGGLPVSRAFDIAKIADPELAFNLWHNPLAVRVQGVELSNEDKIELAYAHLPEAETAPPPRYLFVPYESPLQNPMAVTDEDAATVYFFRDLEDMEGRVVRNWLAGQLIDLSSLAMRLALHVREPLILFTPDEDCD